MTVGWLYVEIEHLSAHELLFAVRFYVYVYVYVYTVLCMRGDFAHLGERATLKFMLHIIIG